MEPDFALVYPQAGGVTLIAPDADSRGLVAFTRDATISIPLTPADMLAVAACLVGMAVNDDHND